MMEQLHNLLMDVRWAIKQLNEHLERIEPTPSSEGEARESSPLAERQTWESEYNRADALRVAPPLCPGPNAPWQDWCHWFDSLDNRVRILEAGPPWPPTTASPTKEAPSDAEPCPHKEAYNTGQWAWWCPDCASYVTEPDSPPESTDPVIPSYLPSDPPTTTFLVVQTCECVRAMAVLEMVNPPLARCPVCDVLWAVEPIPVRDVPASPSEST
jgi:hypothetical protein